jgi:hypothetical protein
MLADEPDYVRLLTARKHFVCTLAAVGHMKYLSLLCGASPSAALQPFPIVAQTVINHANSLSHIPLLSSRPSGQQRAPGWRSYLGRMRRRLREFPTLKPLTPAMRDEFSIPAVVPERYRHLGTIFER